MFLTVYSSFFYQLIKKYILSTYVYIVSETNDYITEELTLLTKDYV